MLLWGTVMLLAGWLLQYGIPCGKKMWSSTFVLITCGMAMCIQALLIYFVDIKDKKKGLGRFFESFGVNPLALYLIGTILAILFGAIPIGHDTDGGDITVHSAVYGFFTSFCNEYTASALYAIAFVLLNWAVGHILYKKRIFIKI
jgi:predicted acyltransferase